MKKPSKSTSGKTPTKKVAKYSRGGAVGGKTATAGASKTGASQPTVTANNRTGVATISKSGTNPGYSAFSMRGLTSNDPANVARNRVGASKYAGRSGGGNSDRDIGLTERPKTVAQNPTPTPPRPRHPIVEKWMGNNPRSFTSAAIPFVRRRRISPGSTS